MKDYIVDVCAWVTVTILICVSLALTKDLRCLGLIAIPAGLSFLKMLLGSL